MRLIAELGNVHKDLDSIIELCGHWWKETPMYKKFGIAYAPRKSLLANLQNCQISVLIRDKDKDNKLVGCYAGAVEPYLYNENIKVSTEICFGILPEYRGSFAGYILLKNIDKYMKYFGIEYYTLSAIVSPEFDHVPQLLNKMGYMSLEQPYMKRV